MFRTERVFSSLVMTFLVLVMVIVCFGSSPMTVRAQEAPPAGRGVTYESVKLDLGDTWESLALRYNNDLSVSTEQFVSEVKRMNHMHTDRLHPGCYLTLKVCTAD